MTYQCTAFRLLISCPSDVLQDTLDAVREEMARWNVQFGSIFGAVVLPMGWTDSAVAAFGDRPQGLINDQLTDQADACLAIFRDKLGSPTGEAVSGTWEEIQRLADAGKPVAILRDQSPRPGAMDTSAAAEALRLQQHFQDEIFPQALVMSFSDSTELRHHVQNFLTRFTSQAQRSADLERERLQTAAPASLPDDSARGVWPRIESNETVEADSSGRVRTHRHHHLVLSNQTGGPVRNVSYGFQLGPDEMFDLSGNENRAIQTLPPGGEMRFPLIFAFGSEPQAQCVVRWTDSTGEHVTEATVAM